MSTYYYSDANNQPIGPYPLSELRNLARSGVITGATLVIEHGSSTWRTWSDIEAEQRPAEIAQAVVSQARQIQGHVQASLAEVEWGSALYGLFLVILQFLILPYTVIRKSLVDLTTWGKENRLPSSVSDLPILTFLAVVLRPPVIVLYLVFGTLGLLYVVIRGTDQYGSQTDIGTRIGIFIGGLIIIYFNSCVIALVFDLISVAIGMANNLRKIAEKK